MSLVRDDRDGNGMDVWRLTPTSTLPCAIEAVAGKADCWLLLQHTSITRGQALLYAELISFTCLNHLLIYYISHKVPILKRE